MDFKNIGSVTGYTKSLQMKSKWQEKKAKGDFQSQSKKSELERKNDSFKAWYREHSEQLENDKTMSVINEKVASGAELTDAEMKYLQSKNPTLWQRLKRDEAEEQAYEDKLKNCKTKDEVEELKFSKVSSAMSAISAVKSNPNIPEGTKLSVAQSEMRKLERFSRITDDFVESGEYSKLPTEEELRRAEKEFREAQNAQEIQDTQKAQDAGNALREEQPTEEEVSGERDEEAGEKRSGKAVGTAESPRKPSRSRIELARAQYSKNTAEAAAERAEDRSPAERTEQSREREDKDRQKQEE